MKKDVVELFPNDSIWFQVVKNSFFRVWKISLILPIPILSYYNIFLRFIYSPKIQYTTSFCNSFETAKQMLSSRLESHSWSELPRKSPPTTSNFSPRFPV